MRLAEKQIRLVFDDDNLGIFLHISPEKKDVMDTH